MELSNSEVLFISHILVKLLKKDIEEKNKVETKENDFIDEIIKPKRGRPIGSLKKCISSER